MTVQVAAQVRDLDQAGEHARQSRLELAPVLTQLGLDVLHPEQLVDLLLGRAAVRDAG